MCRIIEWEDIDWTSNETVCVSHQGGLEWINPRQRVIMDAALKKEFAPLIIDAWCDANPFMRANRRADATPKPR
jgi:hypothetical protein